MIVLISLAMIIFISYAIWIIDVMSNKFNNDALGVLVSLFAILMPPSIIVQVLIYAEVFK